MDIVLLFSMVNILSPGTGRSEQTLQTQIRLLLEEQSDQDLQCLPFYPHLLNSILLIMITYEQLHALQFQFCLQEIQI